MLLRYLAACSSAALLAACAGGTGIAPQAGAAPQAALAAAPNAQAFAAARARRRPVRVELRIKVPRHHAVHRGHGPSYISPATASLKYVVDGGQPVIVAISTSNPNCGLAGAATYLECTVALSLFAGVHDFAFTTYDGANATGNVLSANTNVVYNVAIGTANQIPVTLGGVATSLAVFTNSTAATANQSAGFNVYGTTPVGFSVVPLDADNNVILGSGEPQPAVLATPASTTLVNPSASAPNVWTLTSKATATNPLTPTSSTLTVQATPVPNSGGSTVTASVALSLYRPWLYVVASGSNSIVTYDESGNSVSHSGTFPNATDPTALAYNPDQQWLYETNYSNNAINTYNDQGATAACTGCFAGGVNEPQGITYDSHNRWVYAVDYGANGVSAYDYLGNAETTTAFAGLLGPLGAAFDPTNNLLYVTSYSNGKVLAYAESGGTAVALGGTFPGLDHPWGIAYDAHNGLLYVTNLGTTGNASITAYDDQGNQQTLSGTFPNLHSPHGIVYDPYDQLLYVANFTSGAITAYDEQGNQVTLAGNPTASDPDGLALIP